MSNEEQHLLKVLLLGKYEIGKSCFRTRMISTNYNEYIKSSFGKYEETIGVAFAVKIFRIGNEKFKLQIWDCSGAEKFQMLTESYFRGGKIVFLFYDAYDRASFEKIDYYYRKFLEFKYPPIFILIRNKFDLNMPGTEENIVTDEEAFEYADKNNMLFFHLSNYEKYESGIEEIFQFALNYYKKNIKIEDGERNRCTGVKKPVIYLYPEKPMDITIQLKIKNSTLTTVYPKFNESNNTWKLHGNPNGDIKLKNRIYPYLFWEAETYSNYEINEGFIVKDEFAENFLEEKLKIMGLNDKESTDFITFWLPIFIKNKLSLCSFQNKKYSEDFELNVYPKVDSLIRIFICIKKIENIISIKEQKIEPIKRKGFTLVEWGGSNF